MPLRPTFRLCPAFLRPAGGLLLLALAGACTKATETDGAARLSIVQGNQQTAPVGTLLPLPVVLRVLSASGAPVAQVPVQFSVQAGGGSVDPGTVTSDANGEVKTKWTLGPVSTAHVLSGTAAGVDTVSVVATGVAPREVVVVQGNGQVARAGAALATPIVLRIIGGNNLPIPGQTVTFAVTTGGGSVAPATAVTSAAGEVTLRWTLGPLVGNQSVTATVGALAPVILSALAN